MELVWLCGVAIVRSAYSVQWLLCCAGWLLCGVAIVRSGHVRSDYFIVLRLLWGVVIVRWRLYGMVLFSGGYCSVVVIVQWCLLFSGIYHSVVFFVRWWLLFDGGDCLVVVIVWSKVTVRSHTKLLLNISYICIQSKQILGIPQYAERLLQSLGCMRLSFWPIKLMHGLV